MGRDLENPHIANEAEIEITPDMIDAGVSVITDHAGVDPGFLGASGLVCQVYRAMDLRRRGSRTSAMHGRAK